MPKPRAGRRESFRRVFGDLTHAGERRYLSGRASPGGPESDMLRRSVIELARVAVALRLASGTSVRGCADCAK
jgi:hypothetical protein